MRCCAIQLGLCLAACVWAQQPAKQPSEIQRAIDEFKLQTANLGLRAGNQANSAPAHSLLRDWHGRLYENFRNDFIDAVPHQIVQRGENKGLLRRNQFGFNIAGPLFIPGRTHAKSGTYLSLSYEGVRERIARTHLTTIPTVPERTGDYSHVVIRRAICFLFTIPQPHGRTPLSIPRSPYRSPTSSIFAIRFRAM